jgi:hypothetical protein
MDSESSELRPSVPTCLAYFTLYSSLIPPHISLATPPEN